MEGSPLNATCICIKSLLSGDLGPLPKEGAERLEESEPVDYYSHMMCSHLTGQLYILTDNSCDCMQALARQKSRHGRGRCLESPAPEYLLTAGDCWERKCQFSSGRGYSWDSGWACTHAHIAALRKLYRLNMEESKWKWSGKSGDGDRRIRRQGMGIGGLDQNVRIKFSVNNKIKWTDEEKWREWEQCKRAT